METQNEGYKNWIAKLKSKIQQSQIKVALAVNSQFDFVNKLLAKLNVLITN